MLFAIHWKYCYKWTNVCKYSLINLNKMYKLLLTRTGSASFWFFQGFNNCWRDLTIGSWACREQNCEVGKGFQCRALQNQSKISQKECSYKANQENQENESLIASYTVKVGIVIAKRVNIASLYITRFTYITYNWIVRGEQVEFLVEGLRTKD